jgi:hypothetical protein
MQKTTSVKNTFPSALVPEPPGANAAGAGGAAGGGEGEGGGDGGLGGGAGGGGGEGGDGGGVGHATSALKSTVTFAFIPMQGRTWLAHRTRTETNGSGGVLGIGFFLLDSMLHLDGVSPTSHSPVVYDACRSTL